MARQSLTWWAVGLGLLGCVACRKHESAQPPVPSKAASVVSAPAPAVQSAAALRPAASSPVAGTWAGKYQAQPHLVQMDKKEALVAWSKDDQKVGVGSGTIRLTIEPGGAVTGTSAGPLGSLVAVGLAEEGQVRLSLSPEDPAAEGGFHGVVLLSQEGKELRGRLGVSSGDGALVRDGPVELRPSR